MKFAAALLSLAVLALAAPADARPGGHGRDNGWRNGGGRGEMMERGQGRGRGGPPPQVFYGPGRGVRQGPPPQFWRPRQDSLGAGWRQQQDEARSGVRQGRFVPLNRARAQIGQRFPGRLLDAGIEQGWRGQPVYRVRWAAANGRRMDFIVDARTGAILDTEGH